MVVGSGVPIVVVTHGLPIGVITLVFDFEHHDGR